ncbi:MAG: 50S ribosome-binding GTPase [Thermoguttaceae bacterium]|nr:50S ribosome-binding GTPase [Thermoguttaceae bacterium]MDW8038194.1 GTPase [Thermoguttaceae bacterium]
MVSEEPVYMILLTPPGRGAIATLRLEGPKAMDRLRAWVRRPSGQPVEDLPRDRPVLVRFGPEPAEEVVLRCFSDQSVEIHCHGGHGAVGRIQSLLLQSGCQLLSWKSWLTAQPADSVTKEAIICLAEALTERTASILLDQLHGALQREIQQILEVLEACRTLQMPSDGMDLVPEHGHAGPESNQACQVRSAQERLSVLLDRANLGKHLTSPWQVVLVGRPNVGKSSLLNALVGYSRAIVHPQPGTTRDLVTVTTAMEGWPVQLVDTAGWRDSLDPLEEAGIRLALQKAQQADLVLIVTDLNQPWTATDNFFCHTFPSALLVHNKCDLMARPPASEWETTESAGFGKAAGESERFLEAGGTIGWQETFSYLGTRPSGVWVSAVTGRGLPELIQAIVRRLSPKAPLPGEAVPFTDRQIQLLQAAQNYLKRHDFSAAQNALLAILYGPMASAQPSGEAS